MILKGQSIISLKKTFKRIVFKTVIQCRLLKNWLDGRVVMQRPAKPFTPVRFRLQPPNLVILYLESIITVYRREIFKISPSGGIGRHKGLKIPR